MDYEAYSKLVSQLPLGKNLGKAVYIHAQSLIDCCDELGGFVEGIRHRLQVGQEFNVLKLFSTEYRISFLSYPDIFKDPHPELRSSVTLNLETGKVRRHDYSHSSNPPILHRKEALLDPNHPLVNEFKALTEDEEAEGMYRDTRIIGFKLNWESLLAAKGLGYSGHKLMRVQTQSTREEEGAVEVLRHKTAITRYKFSRPIQTHS